MSTLLLEKFEKAKKAAQDIADRSETKELSAEELSQFKSLVDEALR
jgi:hypothetical protein